MRHVSQGDRTDGEAGFLAQSAVGEGCLARFERIAFKPRLMEGRALRYLSRRVWRR